MRRGSALILAIVLLSCVRVARAQWAESPTYVLRVHVTDRASQIPLLAGMDLDLAGVDVKADTADFVGDEKTYRRLQEAGFAPEIVWEQTQSAIDALSDYLDPAEVSARLDTYQATYPGLAKKVSLGTTVGGRAVWAMKISDNNCAWLHPAIPCFISIRIIVHTFAEIGWRGGRVNAERVNQNQIVAMFFLPLRDFAALRLCVR